MTASNIWKKEHVKLEKYCRLKEVLENMGRVKAAVVPVVTGGLGAPADSRNNV